MRVGLIVAGTLVGATLFAAGCAVQGGHEAPTTGIISSPQSDTQTTPRTASMTKLHDMSAKSLDNHEIKLDKYKGKVMLIVNTASKCGLTPQYAELQKLHEKYEGKGLQVLGFPCNQFAGQEPGAASEIGEFCQRNYGVSFQMFDKIDVNGEGAHPIYKHLTHDGKEPIEWNFAKFLVDKEGNVVKRFPAKQSPAEMTADIEKLTN